MSKSLVGGRGAFLNCMVTRMFDPTSFWLTTNLNFTNFLQILKAIVLTSSNSRVLFLSLFLVLFIDFRNMCFYVCMCVCICISVVTCMKVYLKEFPSKYKYFLLKNVCQNIWLHPTQTVFSPIPQWYPRWVSSTLMNFVELIILKIHFEGVVQRWKLKIEQGRRRRRLLRVKELCWWNKWKFWGDLPHFQTPQILGVPPCEC